MTGVLQVEATGETVGEAKWAALRELEQRRPGLDKAAVHFDVLTEGERGILGVGYAPARVLATAPAAPEVDTVDVPSVSRGDESAAAAQVRELVERVAAAIGVSCSVELEEQAGSILARCAGRDLGLLIGRHGQTIDALQYLANAAVHRASPEERTEVVVDAAGYRDRRRATLEALADRSADRALAAGTRVELEPMSAAERKVVHVYLKERADVETTSEGAEPSRYVVVFPAGA